MIYIVSLYWYTLVACHIPHTLHYRHIIFTIFQWFDQHQLISHPSSSYAVSVTLPHFFIYFSIYLIRMRYCKLQMWLPQECDFCAPTQFNSLSSTMMSIWTRWLKPCLIGLSTSLQNIITVSKYSLPLIVIVGTLSECWSIFACRCLYYHSTGYQWEWDDHDLLLIYSCCLLKDTFVICWTSTTFS